MVCGIRREAWRQVVPAAGAASENLVIKPAAVPSTFSSCRRENVTELPRRPATPDAGGVRPASACSGTAPDPGANRDTQRADASRHEYFESWVVRPPRRDPSARCRGVGTHNAQPLQRAYRAPVARLPVMLVMAARSTREEERTFPWALAKCRASKPGVEPRAAGGGVARGFDLIHCELTGTSRRRDHRRAHAKFRARSRVQRLPVVAILPRRRARARVPDPFRWSLFSSHAAAA